MIYQTSRDVFEKYTSAEVFQKIRYFDTVASMWQHSAKEYADNVAIVFCGKQYTFAELDADVAYFRTVLLSSGIQKGDNVGMLLPNSYDFVKVFLAVTTLGAKAVVLPAQLDEATVFGCSMKFGLKALVFDGSLQSKTGICAVKNPKLVLVDASSKAGEPTAAANVNKDDGCAVLFTGGTTGKSKGALLSNGAFMRGVENGCYGYEHVFEQRYLLVLPLSHVFGLIRNLGTSLQTGSTLYICSSPKDMFKDIAVFKPTILVAVPALVEMSLNLCKQFQRNMFGESLRYIICGAATVAPYLAAECKKFGVDLFAGYGLTESANLVSGNPLTLVNPVSVGIPYPNQQLRIENGELWIKGENMMTCYVGDPEENAAAFEDGWFKTGDLVKIDQDGMLYIVGRTKEIIVLSNGENVSPAEIEKEFNDLYIVQDTQVFEDENELGVPILAMEVVPRMVELNKVDAEDKVKYLMDRLQEVNRRLPATHQIAKIVIRDTDFARTPAMKIVRYKKK